MPKLTQAQQQCLRAIHQSGSAVIQKQKLLAAGEFLPFAPSTALALVGFGMLVFTEPKRLACSETGAQAADKLPTYEVPSYNTEPA